MSELEELRKSFIRKDIDFSSKSVQELFSEIYQIKEVVKNLSNILNLKSKQIKRLEIKIKKIRNLLR